MSRESATVTPQEMVETPEADPTDEQLMDILKEANKRATSLEELHQLKQTARDSLLAAAADVYHYATVAADWHKENYRDEDTELNFRRGVFEVLHQITEECETLKLMAPALFAEFSDAYASQGKPDSDPTTRTKTQKLAAVDLSEVCSADTLQQMYQVVVMATKLRS